MRKNIRDMRLGDLVDDNYIVKFKKPPAKYSTGRKEGKWMELHIKDYTGEIAVRVWGHDNATAERLYEAINEEDVVHVRGTVNKYGENLIIYVNPERGEFVEKVENPDYSEFQISIGDVRWLSESYEEMKEEFWSMIDEVKDKNLRELLNSIFGDDEFWLSFSEAPASKRIHSPYIHGLLHHTLNVARIATRVAELYPTVNRDLVLAGALLHDIGKIREYEIRGTIDLTDDSRLIGHVFLSAEIVDEKIKDMKNFPELMRKKLIHIILSHHGPLENGWGSAKDPAIPEAEIVALSDLMDSQVFQYVRTKEEAKEEISKYDKTLRKHIFLR